jgi:hypothetical protein
MPSSIALIATMSSAPTTHSQVEVAQELELLKHLGASRIHTEGESEAGRPCCIPLNLCHQAVRPSPIISHYTYLDQLVQVPELVVAQVQGLQELEAQQAALESADLVVLCINTRVSITVSACLHQVVLIREARSYHTAELLLTHMCIQGLDAEVAVKVVDLLELVPIQP